jgi:hypothetical protein
MQFQIIKNSQNSSNLAVFFVESICSNKNTDNNIGKTEI